MIIKDRDFIIVGQQPWDNPIGSNCINIAEEIAKNNRVLYVNPPVDRITLMRKRPHEQYILERRTKTLMGEREKLVAEIPNLWSFTPTKTIESINMLPDGALYDFFNKRNNRIYANEIQEGIEKLDFKDYILFNDGDMFRSFYLKDFLKPQVSIYYTRDYFLAVDYWKKHGLRLEPKLMRKSDLITSNSLYLNQLASKHNSNAHYIGQGCDFTLFNPDIIDSIPTDLERIPHPRIGYVGALLNLRLDIDLLINIAEQKPEWQIVLVGPEDEHFKSSRLHELKNVHFLGSKPMELLASYLSGFDVAINPQRFNEVTIGNYPRKIDEYLAMGLPTVATLTETMKAFDGYVYLGENIDDYLELIEKGLTENKEELQLERRQFALKHSWENSVNDMYKAITSTPSYHGN
jgi:glycosyltransferase involved in cell wall biosynthesis